MYQWNHVLTALATVDAARAAQIAAGVLIGDALGPRDEAVNVLINISKLDPAATIDAIGDAAFDEERGWVFHIASFRDLIGSLPVEAVKQWVERTGVEGARKIARHLEPPQVHEGRPSVPELTAWVLGTFGSDDRVFREFYSGVHSFQVYHGDIAAQLEAEVEVARAFRDHDVPAIRKWADWEERRARAEAAQERIEAEERDLP